MALVVIRTEGGGTALVHTSVFDPPPRIPWQTPAERAAAWGAVWARFDGRPRVSTPAR